MRARHLNRVALLASFALAPVAGRAQQQGTPPDLAVADLAVPATAAITSGHGVAHGAPEVMTPSVLGWAADRALTVKTPSPPGAPIDALVAGPTRFQEGDPLQALDHLGSPITGAEIATRMRGAGAGGVVGGLLGGVVGGLIGGLIAVSVCPFEILGPGCSPRDEALAAVAVLSGLAWGGTLGAIAGQEMREIDRWEALELIRAERQGVGTR